MLFCPEQLRVIDISVLRIFDVFKLLLGEKMLLLGYLLIKIDLNFEPFRMELLDKVAFWVALLRRRLLWIFLVNSHFHLSVRSLIWFIIFFVWMLFGLFLDRLSIHGLPLNFCWHLWILVFHCRLQIWHVGIWELLFLHLLFDLLALCVHSAENIGGCVCLLLSLLWIFFRKLLKPLFKNIWAHDC